MSQSEPLRLLAEGKFTRLVAKGHWEWVERVNVSGGVVILPITADRQVVLVRQYRIPVRRRCWNCPPDWPATTPARAGEALIEAARRELLEETGYTGQRWRWLLEGPSSAGLTNESFHLFLAQERAEGCPRRRRRQRGDRSGGGALGRDPTMVAGGPAPCGPWRFHPKIYMGLYFVE